MLFVSVNDFTGEYNIPDSTNGYAVGNLQSYIDRFEKRYLDTLLGVDLAEKIIAYLPNKITSPNADYDFIIAAFSYQRDQHSCIWESAGIKEFLVAAIFFEYTRVSISNSLAGAVDQKVETTTEVNPAKTFRWAEKKFNGVLPTINAIQQYCLFKNDIYTTFAGRRITVKASLFFI